MKAVVLLSGGLDSTVVLALALEKGRECHALSFNYGQKHSIEIQRAKKIAEHYGIPHKILTLDVFANSALVDDTPLAKGRTTKEIDDGGIPTTYVPARNTIFTAFALAQAEILGAQEIYVGPNALDAKPYPDCRPAYIEAYQGLINLATKQAVEGNPPKLIAPLLKWDKKEIVQQGQRLHAPLEMTWSCYNPTKEQTPCGECDACILRKAAFLP